MHDLARDRRGGLDQDLRKMDAEKLGHALGKAIDERDTTVVAYILGTVDAEINRSSWHSDRLFPLRDAACAYLDLYPELPEDPEPEPVASIAGAADVVSTIDESS